MITRLLTVSLLLLSACMVEDSKEQIVIQGHRGCRGLLPENSVEGFKKAVDLGVSVLELDVVITHDNKVLISHEPFISGEICTYPDGSDIADGETEALQIYLMNSDSVAHYPCGHIDHSRFPNQQKLEYRKPLMINGLKEVLDYCEVGSKAIPQLDIELKNREEWYGTVQPEPEEFVSIFLEELNQLDWPSDVSIQSFDMKMLKALKRQCYDCRLVCLNEEPTKSLEDFIEELGFQPDVYSPYFELVNSELVMSCANKSIGLSVWTVNEESDLRAMIDLGVRNIITDYPDRAIKVTQQKGFNIARP